MRPLYLRVRSKCCAGLCLDWSYTGIGEDVLGKGKEAASAPIENQPRLVAVLNVGGMDDDVRQKPERIDKDVALAPDNLLAHIKPLRVKRGAPF